MFVYFVSYQVPNGSTPSIANVEIIREDEIDSYPKVTEIEQVISDNRRARGLDGLTGRVVVTNWILLRQEEEATAGKESLFT